MNKLWKRFRRLFEKRGDNPPFNIHHPDLAGKVEFAFECNGVKYYRAIKDFTLPVGRYKWVDAFLYEVDIRMKLSTLKAFVSKLKKCLDGSTGTLNIGEAWKIVHNIETRCELAFEPETVKRLASVIYFDETEDLSDYDMEYGQKKIKSWEEAGNYDFFLTRPIGELFNVNEHSKTYLLKYIQTAEQIIKDLTLEPENQSSESL